MNTGEEILTSAFDTVAASYDADFTFSNIGRLQRKRVYNFLEKFLPENKALEILEINCGTGEDALWFARKGHRVIATDASVRMIETAIAKSGNQKPETGSQNVKFEIAGFEELKKNYSEKKFDLIFSNFGGLNCIDDIQMKKLSSDLSSLVKPGGNFIAVVMGKKCLWEQLYFILKLNFKKAFRRSSAKSSDAIIGNQIQKTFYYSPAEFKMLTETEFKAVRQKPVGLVLPPSYLEPFFKNKILLLKLLAFKERLLPFYFLCNFADHYFIVMEKKEFKK